MYCRNCGKQLPDGTQFCSVCGAQQNAAPTSYSHARDPKPSVGFTEALKLYFTRYTDFKGRSRRSEYWWATLAIGIIGAIIGAVLPDFSWIWTLVVLIPGLAICVRRLHDVGKSGWWYLWILLPLIGSIILLVQFCKDSEGNNQWGPSPKY